MFHDLKKTSVSNTVPDYIKSDFVIKALFYLISARRSERFIKKESQRRRIQTSKIDMGAVSVDTGIF